MFRILGSVDALNEKNGLNPYPLGFPGRFKGVARWPPLPDEREATRWGFRSRFISSKLPFLHFDAFCTFFFSFYVGIWTFLWFVPFPFLIVFLNGFVNHHATISNISLVNKQSLDKILQAEVFVHKDSQVWAAHLSLNIPWFHQVSRHWSV